MSQIELNVPGINCGHCEHTIKMELSELAGVSNVDASSDKKSVVVEYEPPATEQQIRDLLVEINYAPA
jgi:copper chaperone CopZ